MTFRSTTAAPQRAATSQRIDVARELLLTPFGLDEGHLARALAEVRAHQVDDADLYFQYTRSEGWSLEEGIVKTGSFSIDQGVGVRAVSGEKTAFAYSDDISEASLLDAARAVRAISSATQSRKVRIPKAKIAPSRTLYAGLDPIASMDSTAKVELLGKVMRCLSGGGVGGSSSGGLLGFALGRGFCHFIADIARQRLLGGHGAAFCQQRRGQAQHGGGGGHGLHMRGGRSQQLGVDGLGIARHGMAGCSLQRLRGAQAEVLGLDPLAVHIVTGTQ